MARAFNRLTATKVSKLKGRGRHADGGGLWLNVSHSDNKSWVFRWTPKGGKPREMGLGASPAVPLAVARSLAVGCREMVATGKDPKAERDREQGKTFGGAADDYLTAMDSNWTNKKTQWQWKSTLEERCGAIRNRPVSSIDTADVLSVLNPIWSKIPETASRTRMRIESVLDYAKTKGWRSGENPARWKGHLANTLPKRQKLDNHHAAMNHADLPEFMIDLRAREAIAAKALELLILTACRTSEVLKATWSEFDLDSALWMISSERMKMKRGHRIPLTEAALAVLKPLYDARISDYVFPGQKANKPLSGMAMEMLLRRMGVTDITVHGFRSTFRDWAGDETNFPREIAEAALAHKVGNDVEQAYRRSDALKKRRLLMEAWADFCSGKKSGKVVRIRA
ncbi:MAG: tyrosine-type recombinase/integrase [Rhizobiaceae bacterium]